MDDKRKFKRIETDALIDVLGEELLLYHQINDLSSGGLSLYTPALEPVGSTVIVTVNFPDLNASIDVKAKVIWTRKKPRKSMGLEFVGITDEEKSILQKYLQLKGKS